MPVKEGATLHGSEERGADGKWSPLVGEPADAQRGGYGIARRGRGVGRRGRLEEGTGGAPETLGEDIRREGPFAHRAELAMARTNEGKGIFVGKPTRTETKGAREFRVEGAGVNREPKLVRGGSFLEDGRVPGEGGERQGAKCVGSRGVGRRRKT